MATQKDYYQILGVKKDSTLDQIKRAYKKLAKEHHPDMVKESDKEAAEKRFKEINEAYQVLSDPQKRKMYDQFGFVGSGFGNQGFPGQQGGQWGPFTYTYTSSGGTPFDFGNGGFDPFDIFEEFFGFRGFNSKRPRRGKNLYYQMRIDFKDAVFGVEREIDVESGKVKVKIPAGVRDGTEIKFTGKGMPGPNGAPNGDLFLTVRLKRQRDFVVMGPNLVVVEEISMVDAALGVNIEVPIVDLDNKSGIGKAKLKVPAGTQYGAKFVLRGKGLPMINRSARGNVVVQVLIKVPKRLSKKEKDLLERLQKM
ncbi:DnaJ C-terminal domain-containing protein [Patescibacteria group bacterium]